MIDLEKQKRFLEELSVLTNRYKIGIAGCGCCGSPFLYDANDANGGRYEVEGTERLGFVRGADA